MSQTQDTIMYPGVATHKTLHIALTMAELNDLEVRAAVYIQCYVPPKNIWTIVDLVT